MCFLCRLTLVSGVQGLADAFILLRLPFDSPMARQLNKDIFETMYFAALTASKDLAKKYGPYETYAGSPISQGIFQFDFWGVKPSIRWDWEGLRQEIKQYGVRNSLLLAPMPTASTSQILGNNGNLYCFFCSILGHVVYIQNALNRTPVISMCDEHWPENSSVSAVISCPISSNWVFGIPQ